MKHFRRLSLISFFLLLNLLPVRTAHAAIPGCTVINSDPFWVDDGTIVIQCPTACPDGSFLQCNANLQRQVQCKNGDIMILGPTQPGAVISQIGTCPQPPPSPTPTPVPDPVPVPVPVPVPDPLPTPVPLPVPTPVPAACGSNPSGTTWWQDSGGTTTNVCNTCPDGTPQVCIVGVQAQYQCNDGVSSPTGQTQLGDVLGYQNECLPLPPKACGDQASGSTWWTNSGTQTAACETCWNGSQLTCTYNTQVQEQCSNGLTSATGQTQRGTLIGQNGQCPPQPRACGKVPNGQTTWQDNGKTDPYVCGTCVDGSDHLCIAVLQEQMMCNDGTLQPTGQTQNGPVLGYSNTCPNVAPTKETYQVPTSLPKADVLFVIDTTPTMYKTVVAMAQRFKSLICAWANVDYQIGISNAVPYKGAFDWHPSEGLLMELNPYPVQVKSPLRYITPTQYGGSWIFRRNMSFNGLQWPGNEFCDQQPYCQQSDPEPMRELMRAFSRQTNPANKGFFRPGSTLVPIIVSAHDEKYYGAKDPKAAKPEDVVASFKKNMTAMAGMKAYSMIVQPKDKKCHDEYSSIFGMGDGGIYGASLDKFAKLTGGKSISLCQRDYAKALAGLSQDVRQQISSIDLKHIPWGNSLKISFQPSLPGITWVVQGTRVIFSQALPPGTMLTIDYLYSL